MNTAEREAARRLVLGMRRTEMERASKTALLAVASHRKIVKPGSAESMDRWLDIIVPKVIEANGASALAAARQYDLLRRLELGPEPEHIYKAEPVLNTIDDGIRHAFASVRKSKRLEGDDTVEGPAVGLSEGDISGVAIRGVLNGSRGTIDVNSAKDPQALGFVRVTDGNPCAFCAMLASRGLVYRSFKEGAFKESNERYEGPGDAKVHNSCGCSLKPVFSTDDDFVRDTEKYAEMWREWAGGDTKTAFREFQRRYRMNDGKL